MTEEFPKTALVVVAHPDDAEFGCGGTLALWAREGWQITLVMCTDASGGGADDAREVGPMQRAAITATRKAEQRAAAKVLGLHEVVFLDHPDGMLQPSIELRKQLVRMMRRFKPTRLLCQPPERLWKPVYRIGRHHPDHLAAGNAAISAMYPAAQNGWDFPELLTEGLFPHKVRELWVMGGAEPNTVIDVSEVFDIKLAALREHHSQLDANWDRVATTIREWAVENGKAHGVPMAEVFQKSDNG